MKILVTDDAEMNREILRDILEDEYEIEMAEDGIQALEVMERCGDEIAAHLLDLHMPNMDGLAVLDEMKKRGLMNKIPVLIISSENAVKAEKSCLEKGVSDFIHRPFEETIVKRRIENTISLYAYKNELEKKVEEQTETLKDQCKILRFQATRLQHNNERIIEVLGDIVENRNLESGQHIKRVKGFTKILAYQMMSRYPEYDLDEDKIEKIVNASALHDLGKIAIPDSILLKPARLTKEEFEEMKTHTTRGCDILESMQDIWETDYQKVCYEICRYHHERFDGRGYPDGLNGDDIPVSAQLVSVADVYDALVCERVYKSAIPKDKAYDMIINGECGTFSPKLMDCFKNARWEFEQLADETC